MAKQRPKLNVYEYKDYRHYLKDWFALAKTFTPPLSQRGFAKKAGLKSNNFLILVMQGKRNLSDDGIKKVIKGIQLNKEDAKFFTNLVLFNQTKKHDEKNTFYQNMIQNKNYAKLKPLEKNQLDYCNEWYHAAIRELIQSPQFTGNLDWISQKLSPKLSITKIKKSIQVLKNLNLIEEKNGKLKQCDSLVTTGMEVDSVALFNYHLKMLDLSKKVLQETPKSERDISSLTLGLGKDKRRILKEKIQNFRKDILELVSTEDEPEEVIQVNIQMFPLTIIQEGKNDE